MSNRPADIPDWATAGTITPAPGMGERASGWTGPPQKPPYQYFNHLQYYTWKWIELFRDHHPEIFSSFEEVFEIDPVTGLSHVQDGQLGIVDSYNPTIIPLTAEWDITEEAGDTGYKIVSDSEFIFLNWYDSSSISHRIKAINRETGTELWQQNTPATQALAADGGYVFWDTGANWIKASKTDGSQVAILAIPGGTNRQMYSDGNRVFCVAAPGAAFPGPVHVYGIAYDMSTVIGGFDHGADLYDVCSDGRYCYVAGAQGAGGGGAAQIRQLDYGVTTEQWRRNTVGAGDIFYGIATDEDYVYVAGQAAAAGVDPDLLCLSKYDGSVVWSHVHGYALYSVCVDQNYVWAAGVPTGGFNPAFFKFDKRTGQLLAEMYTDGGTTVRHIDSDGDRIFLAYDQGTANKIASRIYPGYRHTIFRRVPYGDYLRTPFHKLLLPENRR